MTIFDFFRPTGTVDRGRYALAGVLLFAVKYNLDRIVSTKLFGRSWRLTAYVDLPGADAIGALIDGDAAYGLTLVAVALPFIWVGTVLTLKRLRDAGLPGWLVLMFFAPFVNLLFFTALAIIPSGSATVEERPAAAWLHRAIPEERLGSAALAIGLTAPAGVAGTALSVSVLKSYGWGVFVGLPFALGLVAALLHGYHRERSLADCFSVGMISVTLLGGILALIAAEGLVCLIMAAPIALLLAVLGAGIGYVIQKRPSAPGATAPVTAAVALALVGLMVAEDVHDREAPLVAVSTSVTIDAPRDQVWDRLIDFSEIAPPKDWLFKTGIAYPIRAEIYGTGVGAVRECIFTTGSFVEPITVWDEPRELAFEVLSQPDPMQEWTFYRDIRPAHIDGYFRSEQGQFLLKPTESGGTELIGTTWYRNDLWPNRYWNQWSDFILHRIHRRVLEHVRRAAETRSRSLLPFGEKDRMRGSSP